MPEEVLHDPAFTLMCYYAFGVWHLVLIAVAIGYLVTPHRWPAVDPNTSTPGVPTTPSAPCTKAGRTRRRGPAARPRPGARTRRRYAVLAASGVPAPPSESCIEGPRTGPPAATLEARVCGRTGLRVPVTPRPGDSSKLGVAGRARLAPRTGTQVRRCSPRPRVQAAGGPRLAACSAPRVLSAEVPQLPRRHA